MKHPYLQLVLWLSLCAASIVLMLLIGHDWVEVLFFVCFLALMVPVLLRLDKWKKHRE